MNIAEASEYTGYTIKTLYYKVHLREVPFIGGKRVRLEFDPMELDIWQSLNKTKEAARAIMRARQDKAAKKIGYKLRRLAID
jgi:hypothetical protein